MSAFYQEDSKELHSGMSVPAYLSIAEVVSVVFKKSLVSVLK